MKTRTIAFALTGLLAAVAVCFAAEDLNIGTWKLNEAKSKMASGTETRNVTVVYAPAGDSVKVTLDYIDASGKPIHNEWIGKFDGKDYAVTGDPGTDMRSYKWIGDHTFRETVKKGGKVIGTVITVIAADGKTRTSTATFADASGKKVTNIGVFDKK
jgi:hypothetical protein